MATAIALVLVGACLALLLVPVGIAGLLLTDIDHIAGPWGHRSIPPEPPLHPPCASRSPQP